MTTIVAIIISMDILGIKIKEFRSSRDWTQNELARRSGIDRATLASIESGKSKHPTTANLLKLARAFNIRPEELYLVEGYIDTNVLHVLKEKPEDILERLRLAQPQSVPVYSEFPVHAGGLTEPVDYVYRARPMGIAPKNIEGYVIRGHCLVEHGIKDSDIIIVDRDGAIDEGDIVACLTEWGMLCGQLKNVAGELYLENNRGQYRFRDCQVAAVVIEVIRRLK